ncbi:MAG: hypothetical protein E7214_02695 [Clostridium sp.]|nr:hypothetical protein [Clostridium sp.]
MNVLNEYIENMFINLPKTKQIQILKNNILLNMEDKYNDLLDKGISENEAIGIVISEFGDINEIMEEYDLEMNDEEAVFSDSELNEFIEVKNKSSWIVSLGVLCCILSISSYMILEEILSKMNLNSELVDLMSFASLIVLIAISVGMFIYSNNLVSKYEKIKEFSCSNSSKIKIENKFKKIEKKYDFITMVCIIAMVISPLIYFIFEFEFGKESNFPATIYIVYISIFIAILTYVSSIREVFKILIGEKESSKTRYDKKISNFAGVTIFMIATIIYLIWSFVFKAWSISWITFVVATIIYGLISRTIYLIREDK